MNRLKQLQVVLILSFCRLEEIAWAVCNTECGGSGFSYDSGSNTIHADSFGCGNPMANEACQAIDSIQAWSGCGFCGGCANFQTNGAGVVSCRTAGCAACSGVPEAISGNASKIGLVGQSLSGSILALLIVSFVYWKLFRKKATKKPVSEV